MTENLESRFDLQAWKKQGKERIIAINELLVLHQKKIDEVKKLIEQLEEERVEILSVLGENKEKKLVTRVRKKKVIIRPILLEKLMSSIDRVSETDLVDYVQEEKPSASARSIKVSLDRLIKSHPNISETSEGILYHRDNDDISIEKAS